MSFTSLKKEGVPNAHAAKSVRRALGRAYLYANDARREIIILSDENPVDKPPGSNLARLDEVALEDCAAGRYGLHCPPQATAFALGNCDTLLHKDCTATWYVVVLAVWQVCF